MSKKQTDISGLGLTLEQQARRVADAVVEAESTVEAKPASMSIYVAGPYTKPDPDKNTSVAMFAFLQLMRKGHHPYCPHLSHFPDQLAKHIGRPVSYEEWMELDLVWLAKCDALLRLEGESSGADREVEFARLHSIPVYWSMAEVPNVVDGFELREAAEQQKPKGYYVFRPFCKACGAELFHKALTGGPITSRCPRCQSFDPNVCPDCDSRLVHPGCGDALKDLGYDRICMRCTRTFVFGDPRTYGAVRDGYQKKFR